MRHSTDFRDINGDTVSIGESPGFIRDSLEVKFKKLADNAVIPAAMTDGAAGLDITCTELIKHADHYEYKTGLAIEIPQGHLGFLIPRSSNAKYDLVLSNHIGLIDSDYRGEVLFKYKLDSNGHDKKQWHGTPLIYKPGDRIGQLVILPYPKIIPVEATELSETKRGTGGYGSTNEQKK